MGSPPAFTSFTGIHSTSQSSSTAFTSFTYIHSTSQSSSFAAFISSVFPTIIILSSSPFSQVSSQSPVSSFPKLHRVQHPLHQQHPQLQQQTQQQQQVQQQKCSQQQIYS